MKRERFTDWLALATVATYLVIIVGSTVAVTRIGAACPTWPTCNGYWIPPFESLEVAIAWGYRVLVAATGAVVLGTAVSSWFADVPKKVRAAMAVALVLYPLQVGVGALVATGPTSLGSATHLVFAVVIFTALLVSLTWTLEGETPETETRRAKERESGNTDETAEHATPSTGLRARVMAYVELTKPRLMWLLCLVAVAAMGMASPDGVEAGTVVATLLGGVLAIGASGTFNNIIEREKDEKMDRTNDRPIVENRVPVVNAAVFGLGLAAASVAVFVAFVNLLAATLGVVAILFYSVVYTVVLKPNTSQNIVIGGAVGALPALIGWAAVTETVGVPAVVLGGVIFLWTPAHFYNLALVYKKDYEEGGFPMLPVVRGEDVTRRHILLYLGATLVAASLLGAVAPVGWVYALTSTVFGGIFVWAVVRMYRRGTETATMRSFHASNAYLGTLLIAIVVDTLLV